ncbi:uncharacterized protein [Elaeis guineensis]|uniref:uncharacterized protein isoform X3 n=1 Tax=Elaeis guineensis var. tenera TaxID=51953 RepID=UPI003C6D5550
MHRKDILWFVLYKLYISVVFFPLSVTVGARDLKLPLQNENPMVDDSGMSNLVTIGKAATLTSASDFKGSLKNMEKSKGNHNGSANPNVRRKALADVTNVAVNIYKNAKHDGSKPMKAKADRSMFLQRPSLGPGARTVNAASRKSFMGTAKVNLCQGAGDMHTSERGIKDTKASSCYQRSQARISSQESFVNIRRTARSSLIPTRKSLPVLKRVNQGDANDSKGCAQNSGEAKEMSNAPVKAKFGKNVAPRVNNGRSHLRRNRASDGFMIMGPTASADACVLSRKSVKPIVKTTLRVSNTRRASKSKCSSALIKSRSVVSISSKKKEVASSFHLERTALEASDEATQAQPISDGIQTQIQIPLPRKNQTVGGPTLLY